MRGRGQTIFEGAIELPEPERPAFVARQCAGDAALAAEVESLLRAHSRASGFLGGPTGQVPPPFEAISETALEAAGARIGPYKLLHMIGEGGFGSVFMAQQEEPVRRRVALKIIKLGMDTRQVIARFEAERQALAMMEHPNIARVFDAGATATGRPYFVMELVRGIPITDYCDTHSLTVRERLELFVPVCQAVQHAHQRGIIHRDVKPSNVLVTTSDSGPIPKVIDFGIAKATAGRLTEKTLFTEHRQVIGTPEYMSPEQAEMTAIDIDTRSDVYSLGVLLYELLTGVLPFDSERLRSAAFAEIQRIIREEEAPRPSTRLSKLDSLPSVAAHRKIDPARLGRLVRGDLDWITMKCLEKDRTRRYESASGLAADLQRHLAGDAVIAAPPSTAYRVRKFVRRNRGPVIAAGLVAGALVLGIVGTSVGLYRAHRATETALAAKAETEARRAEIKQVADFQARMLGQVDAADVGARLTEDLQRRLGEALGQEGLPDEQRSARIQALGDSLRRVNATDAAAAMLDRTILCPALEAVDREFKDQPLVDAALRKTLGDLYRRLGRYDQARPLHERALATRRRLLGNDHPDTLQSIADMGTVLEGQGKPADAEVYYREALDSRRRVLGDEHRDTLTSMNNMGHILQILGRFSEAEPYYLGALEARRRTLGPDHEDTLVSVSDVGFLLEAEGKAAEAEPYYRDSLEGSRRVLGNNHRDTLTSVNNMGYLLQELGRLTEAEPYLHEALDGRRRVLGENHPDTIDSIGNLGSLFHVMRREDDAERCFREALDKCRHVYSDDHPKTLITLGNLATVLQEQHRYAEAEPLHRESADRLRRVLGDEHPDTLIATAALGSVLESLNRAQEAEALYRQTLEQMRRVLGEDHPTTLVNESNLAFLLRHQKRETEAEALLRDGLERMRRVHGDTHPSTLSLLGELAECLRAQGRLSEAEPLLRERIERFRARVGDKRPETAMARTGLATLLRDTGRYAESAELFLLAEPVLGSEGAPPGRHTQCIRAIVDTYQKWDAAEPGKGYGQKAQDWRAKLEADAPKAGGGP